MSTPKKKIPIVTLTDYEEAVLNEITKAAASDQPSYLLPPLRQRRAAQRIYDKLQKAKAEQ